MDLKCEGEQTLGHTISEVPFPGLGGSLPTSGCRTFGSQEHGEPLEVVGLVPLVVVHHEPVVPWGGRAGRQLRAVLGGL